MADTPSPHLEPILGLTAFAAGSVDIISFTKLGGNLASAMTGNLAFLGLYLTSGRDIAAIGSAGALAAFIIGGAIATQLTRGQPRDAALQTLLRLETLLLAGFVALWFTIPNPSTFPHTDLLIAPLAISMGIQSIIGKKINLSNIPTIVFTSTLINIVVAITDNLAQGKFRLAADTKRQSRSFLLYFAGALAAGLLLHLHSPALVILPLAALAAALTIQLRHK